jgi:tetratricopeptide (TPR) repeat protein
LGRGKAYSDSNEYGKARTDLKKAARLAIAEDDTSGMAQAYNALGDTYQSQASYDKAIAFYEKAIALDDKKAVYHQNCGNAYYRTGEYGKARTDLKEAARLAEAENDTAVWQRHIIYRATHTIIRQIFSEVRKSCRKSLAKSQAA